MCVIKNSSSLLSLLQLISPNWPLGGFIYSQGLEWAIKCNWVNSTETFVLWQKQWINGPLIYLDWPMLKRCYYYAQIKDKVEFLRCALKILSYRGTCELRKAERQRGRAMTKLIVQWYSFTSNDEWLLALEHSGLASIAWLGSMWGISLKDLALGYAYSMLELSVMVGLKLIPFGQNTAQKLLRNLVAYLPYSWDKSNMLTDDELGDGFLLQSIASSCHEIQYSRLFRS